MQMTPMDRDLLGVRDYPPVVRELRTVWMFTRRWPTLPMLVLATLIVAGVFAPVLSTHDPYSGGIRNRHIPPLFFEEGSTEHLLGTDHAGRDVFSRMLFGARISLVVGAIALTFGFLVGTTMGMVARPGGEGCLARRCPGVAIVALSEAL